MKDFLQPLKSNTYDYDISSWQPIDWRKEGVVNPVIDQGGCGSCWAWSANGALETQYAFKTKQLVQLSA